MPGGQYLRFIHALEDSGAPEAGKGRGPGQE